MQMIKYRIKCACNKIKTIRKHVAYTKIIDIIK